MKQLIFSTTNPQKFLTAKHVCDQFNIKLLQNDVDITEIQGEDSEKVARDKASKAYETVKQPVVITDDSWAFLGLNGFPGVYMHSINTWFTPEDLLRLVLPLKNRKAILTQHLVFDDGTAQKVFLSKTEGTLLKEIRGTSKYPNHTVVTLSGDSGLSIAEAYDKANDKSTLANALVWQSFAEWFSKKQD